MSHPMRPAMGAMGKSVTGKQLPPYCMQEMGVQEYGFPVPLHPIARGCNASAAFGQQSKHDGAETKPVLNRVVRKSAQTAGGNDFLNFLLAREDPVAFTRKLDVFTQLEGEFLLK